MTKESSMLHLTKEGGSQAQKAEAKVAAGKSVFHGMESQHAALGIMNKHGVTR